jgi:hypothetical protein
LRSRPGMSASARMLPVYSTVMCGIATRPAS